MPIQIAANPLYCVALGSGQSLEEFDALKGVLFSVDVAAVAPAPVPPCCSRPVEAVPVTSSSSSWRRRSRCSRSTSATSDRCETAQDSVQDVLEPVAGGRRIGRPPGQQRLARHRRLRRRQGRERPPARRGGPAASAGQVDQVNARDQLDTILAQQQIETTGATPRKLARVVSGPASNFENTIRIDKGAEAGIARRHDRHHRRRPGRAGQRGHQRPAPSSSWPTAGASPSACAWSAANAQATFLARGQAPGSPLVHRGERRPQPRHAGRLRRRHQRPRPFAVPARHPRRAQSPARGAATPPARPRRSRCRAGRWRRSRA